MKSLLLILALLAYGNTAVKAQPKLKIGDTAPNIELEGPNGKTFELYDIKKKYVLVDFWASWCRPCRKENPNVVSAYEKYSKAKFKDAKGFTIFSVSLDNNVEKWAQAIEADGLDWKYHVSDLKGWKSDPAKAYGVNSIPGSYLIGPDHKIIAINLRGMALHEKLDELIESF